MGVQFVQKEKHPEPTYHKKGQKDTNKWLLY